MADGIKRADIQPCACCGQGLAKGGPIIYRVQVERFVLNPHAIQRQAGLEMAIGGPLASILGPNEDLAEKIDSDRMLVCGNCIVRMPHLLRDSDERGEAPHAG
jgi:hypothetical protein